MYVCVDYYLYLLLLIIYLFLFTRSQDRLAVDMFIDLFAVGDEKFMDMFVAPGTVAHLQDERQSLHKRQKVLQSCLTEFKNIARTL